MIFSNRPLFYTPSADGWREGTINPVPGGVTVVNPDGTVLSVQPDGRFESRPAGTAGSYEVAIVDGSDLVYNPGTPYVVPMRLA